MVNYLVAQISAIFYHFGTIDFGMKGMWLCCYRPATCCMNAFPKSEASGLLFKFL
jgi:hypothetical protein